ncbi:MAG TPA: hypothetical protein VHX59_04195 [Mycobacteriales bacterium]|jgi:hypothetical protein|nr:hypothetical protein [Mycobacteriales bacterium]
MTIVLNHTIVPVADRRRGAELLAALLGLTAGAPVGPFAPARMNDDLTFDFDERFGARPAHYGIAYELFTAIP